MSYRTRCTTDIVLSPSLLPFALSTREFHEDFGLSTIWKKWGYYRLGTMEKTGRGRSSEYMYVITMFPGSSEDAHAVYSGQFQH